MAVTHSVYVNNLFDPRGAKMDLDFVVMRFDKD